MITLLADLVRRCVRPVQTTDDTQDARDNQRQTRAVERTFTRQQAAHATTAPLYEWLSLLRFCCRKRRNPSWRR